MKTKIKEKTLYRRSLISNQKGQGLIEYLILTALLAVATMGVVRIMGQSVAAKFADVTNAIQGGPNAKKAPVEKVEERHYKKKDMSDFMQGAVSRDREK